MSKMKVALMRKISGETAKNRLNMMEIGIRILSFPVETYRSLVVVAGRSKAVETEMRTIAHEEWCLNRQQEPRPDR